VVLTMSTPAVKALTFDVFGTVVDWRESIPRLLTRVLGPKGYSLDWHDFADQWRAKSRVSLERVRTGERAWMTLDAIHHENLVELFHEQQIVGLTSSEIEELSRSCWRSLDPWADSVEGLNRLKREFIIATLSNGNIALMVDLAKYAELPWDAVLGAEISRTFKNEPPTYLRSAEALGLRPDECMMVAAHSADLLAARDCGFHTAYIKRPMEYGKDHQPEPFEEFGFDVVAEDLIDLARKLRG
jgi:2-haloacid dehalogenase